MNRCRWNPTLQLIAFKLMDNVLLLMDTEKGKILKETAFHLAGEPTPTDCNFEFADYSAILLRKFADNCAIKAPCGEVCS